MSTRPATLLECGVCVGARAALALLNFHLPDINASSRPHDQSSHHEIDARIKEDPKRPLVCNVIVSSSCYTLVANTLHDAFEPLIGKLYSVGLLVVLLYGCESCCCGAEFISQLRSWHTTSRSFVHQKALCFCGHTS